MDETAFLPQWTKPAAVEGGGRDPLGLSRLTVKLTDYLLRGIISTAFRARYYSFLCWNIWHTSNVDQPETWAEFVQGLARREVAMAMASGMGGADSFVGYRRVHSELGRQAGQDKLSLEFPLLSSNSLGAYGQIYGGSLHNLGLTKEGPGGRPEVTEAGGLPLALAVHEVLKETPYIKRGHYNKTRVPRKVLEQSRGRMSLDSLPMPVAKEECRLVRHLFFSQEASADGFPDSLRRKSLTRVLWLVKQYEEAGHPLRYAQEVESHLLFGPAYFEELLLSEGENAQVEIPSHLTDCNSFWRQFCTQEYFTHALERMLWAVRRAVNDFSGAHGLPLEDLFTRIAGSDFEKRLKDLVKGSAKSPKKTMTHLRKLQRRNGLPRWNSELSEEAIARLGRTSAVAATAESMLLLLMLHLRWRESKEPAMKRVKEAAGGELWIGGSFGMIDSWIERDVSWREAVEELVQALVFEQHDRIMYEKRRLESARIRVERGAVHLEQDFWPVWRTSRLRNAVSMLRDVGLVSTGDDSLLRLTDDGRDQLSSLDAEGRLP